MHDGLNVRACLTLVVVGWSPSLLGKGCGCIEGSGDFNEEGGRDDIFDFLAGRGGTDCGGEIQCVVGPQWNHGHQLDRHNILKWSNNTPPPPTTMSTSSPRRPSSAQVAPNISEGPTSSGVHRHQSDLKHDMQAEIANHSFSFPPLKLAQMLSPKFNLFRTLSTTSSPDSCPSLPQRTDRRNQRIISVWPIFLRDVSY